jgi:hypothetical protein
MCSASFRNAAAEILSFRFGGRDLDDPSELQQALLDFIGEFAAWPRAADVAYLDAARRLVDSACEGRSPLVADPFGGGGSIPLEALRAGAEAWAADYNPVTTLILKVLLEDIPRFGDALSDGLTAWAETVKSHAEKQLKEFYPPNEDGAVPVAYLWARVGRCEGPGCDAAIPLLRNLWLSRKTLPGVALRVVTDRANCDITFEIDTQARTVGSGTVRGGSAICPICSFVTPRKRLEAQMVDLNGGTQTAKLIAVIDRGTSETRRRYRLPTDADRCGVASAIQALSEIGDVPSLHAAQLSPVRPSPAARGVSAVTRYGMTSWSDVFTQRQSLALLTFSHAVRESYEQILETTGDLMLSRAIATLLAFAVDRLADFNTALCRWRPRGEDVAKIFSKQALAMVWDFVEVNPLAGELIDWDRQCAAIAAVCRTETMAKLNPGVAERADARHLPLDDESVDVLFTDPPYYDQIPYSDLSDFFQVWLFESVGTLYPELLGKPTLDKHDELVVNAGHEANGGKKDDAFFRSELERCLMEARRVLKDESVAVIVFAHKETEGWEAMLGALIESGWTVTASWPLETEMTTRVRAQRAASLQSSIHIVCRPRVKQAGVGSWRDVRPEIERRINEWLPRLAREGIEGADAIFACLGPSLEAYSRYECVTTAAGNPVPLSPPAEDHDAAALLPAVWASVARAALSMLFEGADAEGFEEDARLTAVWLWTLKARANGDAASAPEEQSEDETLGEQRNGSNGLALDFDTARKLAQGLGAHLDALDHPGGIVELRGTAARLRSVSERRTSLLGETADDADAGVLFESDDRVGSEYGRSARTTLDRLHHAMLLFGGAKRDRLTRLLAEPGYASDEAFMRLARCLSALYPSSSQEKRWIDGVLATRARSQ